MALIQLRVQPGASQSRVVGKVGDDWKIAIHAAPVDGKANAALLKFLANRLGVPRSRITIKCGLSSRRKTVEIAGLEAERVAELLKDR